MIVGDQRSRSKTPKGRSPGRRGNRLGITDITTTSGRAGSVSLHGLSARVSGLQPGSLPEGRSHIPRSVTPRQKNSSKNYNLHLLFISH